MSVCLIPDCGRQVKCRGLCNKHYQAARSAGTVPAVRADRWIPGDTIEAKLILNHVVDPETGCWRWTRGINSNGYGYLAKHDGFSSRLAHRIAYELWVGPIPDGYQIDHVRARGCMYRECINPAHLEAVTQAENIRRGDGGIKNRSKTHCRNGHEFTPENTYIGTEGGRYCRTCQAAHKRAWRRRQRVDPMTGTLTIHWRRPPGYDGWSVHDSDLGWLQTFETLAEAEAWVIAEGERRDAEPTP